MRIKYCIDTFLFSKFNAYNLNYGHIERRRSPCDKYLVTDLAVRKKPKKTLKRGNSWFWMDIIDKLRAES